MVSQCDYRRLCNPMRLAVWKVTRAKESSRRDAGTVFSSHQSAMDNISRRCMCSMDFHRATALGERPRRAGHDRMTKNHHADESPRALRGIQAMTRQRCWRKKCRAHVRAGSVKRFQEAQLSFNNALTANISNGRRGMGLRSQLVE